MPQAISPLALLGGSGMIVVALAFLGWGLRKGSDWSFLGLGAFAWFVTVAIKVVIALPLKLNPWVLAQSKLLVQPWSSVLVFLYGGLLTGVTEVGLVWPLLRYTRLRRTPWRNVLGFGIGFGAFEALLLGFGSLVGTLVAMTQPQLPPPEALQALTRADRWPFQLAPIWERVFACLGHLATNVMLFYAVARPAKVWFWWALIYKSLVDGLVSVTAVAGYNKTVEQIWTIEAAVAIWGLAGWLVICALGQRYPQENPIPLVSKSPAEIPITECRSDQQH